MSDPAIQQEELEASFRTHANYLRAFSHLFGFPATPLRDRADQVFEKIARDTAAAFPKPKGTGGTPDLTTVGECLNRAWGTELLLGVSRRIASEEELCRLANSWGAVQTYYVAYAATQALIVATGRERPTTHPRTQDQTIDLWVTRSGSVAPMSFAATSFESTRPHVGGFLNGPGRDIADISPWSSCSSDTCWDIAAKALRSTRDRAVTTKLDKERATKASARKKAWQAEEDQRVAAGKKPRKRPSFSRKANLTTPEKRKLEQAVRPHTVVDYLFRLRIKANYEEAHMFTSGPGDNNAISTQVARDFHRIAASVMLANEVRIGQLVGKDWLLETANEWVDKNSPQWSLGIKYRLDLLGDIL